MRPLDRLRSIKTKLGVLVVAAVAGTTLAIVAGVKVGLPWWLSAVAAGIVGLAVIQLLARGMTSPLREMAVAASAMARGEYERRVTATSRDEVGQLAAAFNRMASDLAEVDRLRRDLVAMVSHELRTPISALQAVLENLIDGVEPPAEDTLRTMLKQVERLGRLVSQLLDLSRLESGAVPLQRADFEILPLLEQVAHEARANAGAGRAEKITLTVDADPPQLSVNADPERVHQVIANLVDNAVRHSPERATVRVAARQSAERVAITVTDEGPGIPREEASRVFERFYRADGARGAPGGGTGLGLAIARWIVDLHGGEIRAEEARPRGCRIVVELPRAAS